MSPRKVATLLLRLLLAAVFLYAAASKILDPQKFAQEIANYRLLPMHLVPAAAAAMPVCEIAIGGLLATGVLASDAALAACLLLALFTTAVASSLVRGIDLVCGCFGGQELVSGWTLARDLALLAASLLLLWLQREPGGELAAPASP